MASAITLHDALSLTGDARIVTRSTPPYSIVHTNRLNADVVHNASKRITFDLAADLADRVC